MVGPSFPKVNGAGHTRDLVANGAAGIAPPADRKNVYKIASIPADGIGPEVVEAGIAALQAIAKKRGDFSLDFTHFDWSSETYKKTGSYLPKNHLDILRQYDAIL